MKNKVKLFLVATFVMVAGHNVYTSQQEINISALSMANVEALANEESKFEYPDGYPYSSTCNVAIGSSIWGTKRCKVEVITCQGGGTGCTPKDCPSHPS